MRRERPAPEDPIALTIDQERRWFLEKLEPARRVLNVHAAVRLTGRLDVEALAQAFRDVEARYPILRATFPEVDGRPVVRIEPAAPTAAQIPIDDLSQVEPADETAAIDEWLREIARRPFLATTGSRLRRHLLRLGDDDNILTVSMHGLVAADASLTTLARELTRAYARATGAIEEPGDTEVWIWPGPQPEDEWLDSEPARRGLDKRAKQLTGVTTGTELPTDHPRGRSQTFAGAGHSSDIPSLGGGSTGAKGYVSAFAALLARYTTQDDLVFGAVINPQLFMPPAPWDRPLPIRIDLAGAPSVETLQARVDRSFRDMTKNGLLPFQALLDRIDPPRDLSHSPLFQLAFEYTEPPPPLLAHPSLAPLPFPVPRVASEYDLTFRIHCDHHSARLEIIYNSDLFDAETIDRMAGHYERILTAVATDPKLPCSGIPLLTDTEREQQVVHWNDTQRDFPEVRLPDLVAAQCARTPEAIAVVCGDDSITYGDLDRRVNQLANHLRTLGVERETLVGVCLDRSIDMVVSLLGIMRSGGAYVPLDPAFPANRLAFMLADSKCPVLVTQASLAGTLPIADTDVAHVVRVDTDASVIAAAGDAAPEIGAETTDLAYVIYTSGSTGKPKGVMIEHRALVNFLHSMQRHPGLDADDVLVSVTTISFDIAALELYLPLVTGARLVVARREDAADPVRLARLMETSGATVMQATPATWRMLLDGGWTARPPLRVLCGGEALPRELAEKLLEHEAPLFNMYGPTETTIWSSVDVVTSGPGPVSIGRPIDHTQIYLLDDAGAPVPIGVAGELLIGGDGLARGYFDRPELTAERFVDDPFRPGQRLYRTGDLCRYRPDGRIEFVSRLDHQVKVRGFRIECGEIESRLADCPGVARAVVVAHGPDDDRRLVAYMTVERAAPATADLRDRLGHDLPDYMVPSTFVVLDEFPLTPNEKIDRNALPDPAGRRAPAASDHVAPSTDTERALAAVFADVLGVEPVGATDDFFALGGHSLLATRVIARLPATCGVELPLARLFERPTVVGLAAAVDEARSGAGRAAMPALTPVDRDTPVPLTFAQQRIWFLDQLAPGDPVYDIPIAARLTGALDVPTLERSIAAMVQRHEVLRCRFETRDGRPVQIVTDTPAPPLTHVDLRPLDPADRSRRVSDAVDAAANHVFDLAKPPLLHATLIRTGETEHVFVVTIHHIVSDGWSMAVLARELERLYEAYSTGATPGPPDLDDLPVQYVDYAAWHHEWLGSAEVADQLAYWTRQLAALPPPLRLPGDRPHAPSGAARGAQLTRRLPAGLGRALRDLSRTEGATVFMTLLAAFETLLHRWTGATDLVVGTPIAGRTRLETEPMIGCFLNLLVLRTDLGGDPTFRDVLRRVRETALGAYANQDLPYERLLETLHPDRTAGRATPFRVFFNHQDLAGGRVALRGLDVDPIRPNITGSLFDLTLYVEEESDRDDGLELIAVHDADVVDAAIVAEMLAQLELLLTQIVRAPDSRIGSYALLTTAARALLPDPTAPLSAEWRGAVPDVVAAHADRAPDRVAVTSPTETWTYRDLDRAANRLAHTLLDAGIEREEIVAVYAHRGATLAWALLGILKAGAAFVILDPAQPAPRLADGVRRARPRASLAISEAGPMPDPVTDALTEAQPRLSLTLPPRADGEPLADAPATAPDVAIGADDFACLGLTSGSLGHPKGIVGRHGSLSHFVPWYRDAFDLGPSDRFAMMSALAHDPLHRDVFLALQLGATIVIPDPDTLRRWASC